MTRNMFLTFSIVLAIYGGLLLLIDHPFTAGAAPAKDEAATPLASLHTDSRQTTKTDTETKKHKVPARNALFKGPTIVGISNRVDLNAAQGSVQQVWDTFQEKEALQNNVAWEKGNIKVYAYYFDFDADLSHATLMIGFDEKQLRLHSTQAKTTLPTGEFERFSMSADSNTAKQSAWLKAYVHKNLIERHTLNRDGDIVSAEAIVVHQ